MSSLQVQTLLTSSGDLINLLTDVLVIGEEQTTISNATTTEQTPTINTTTTSGLVKRLERCEGMANLSGIMWNHPDDFFNTTHNDVVNALKTYLQDAPVTYQMIFGGHWKGKFNTCLASMDPYTETLINYINTTGTLLNILEQATNCSSAVSYAQKAVDLYQDVKLLSQNDSLIQEICLFQSDNDLLLTDAFDELHPGSSIENSVCLFISTLMPNAEYESLLVDFDRYHADPTFTKESLAIELNTEQYAFLASGLLAGQNEFEHNLLFVDLPHFIEFLNEAILAYDAVYSIPLPLVTSSSQSALTYMEDAFGDNSYLMQIVDEIRQQNANESEAMKAFLEYSGDIINDLVELAGEEIKLSTNLLIEDVGTYRGEIEPFLYLDDELMKT